MKNVLSLLLVVILLAAGSSANAQFEKGDKIVNAGIGFSDAYYSYGGYSGGALYLGASFEAAITDFIGVGAQVDIRPYSYYGSRVSVPVAARGAYHFGKHFLKIEQLDVYGGASAGVNIDGYSGYGYSARRVVVGGFAGARWYFNPNFGVNAEFGGGMNVANARFGVSFKF